MKKIIRNLRMQPEDVRRNVLHILTFLVAVVMVLLWVFSLNKSLSNPNTQTKMQEDLKPFSQLKDSVVNIK